MSRTGEIVLTVIGALIYVFLTFVGGVMVWLINNETMWNQAKEEILKQPEIAQSDMEAFTGLLQGGVWLFVALSAIGCILGIVAIVFMKGDKKPQAAGIMLIVMAVLGAIGTFGGLIFSGVFYLIAGIMCLARKKPQTITME